MEIIRAKTAGFCFGVDRAVKLTYDLLAEGRKVATLGPLIHNAQVVADLEAKGAVTCPDIDAVPDGYEMCIRDRTIDTAHVNESAVRGQALDNALILLADLNIGPELLALSLVGLGSDLVDGADDLAAGALGDDQLNMLADELGVCLLYTSV